jgi:AraC-like DNA-binding protein
MIAALMTGCASNGDQKDATGRSLDAGFNQTMSVADSLYNSMQFRDAYKLYRQLLDNKEAKADSEKRLNVLNALSNTSELSGHKVEQHKWLQQMIDLAVQTGNDYYQSLASITMGQNLFYEGDRERGIYCVNLAIDQMAKTDRENTDHLLHGYLNMLASMYSEMRDYDNALKTNERNLQLTVEGTRWGAAPNQQLIDRRMALAKMASVLARMGRSSSGSQQSRYYQQADSVYAAWQAVQYEGNHTRDYFIVDYMKRRGLYQEAFLIYSDLIQRVRQHGDTLGEMMNTAKWGLADVCQQMGRYQQAADLYEQVLVIQDTLKSRKARNTAQELAAVYHEKEQEEIIMQQQAENTRQRYQLFSVLAILIVVIALAVVVIAKNRIINRKNRALVKLIDENIKLKTQPQPQPMKEGDNSSLFTRLSTEIREQQLYLDPSFDRQAVCDHFHLTPVQVGNAFAQGSDYNSVADFIRDCRLEHACHLLKTTGIKIADVAASAGFSRVTTFNHDFKARYNLSPSEYRRQ